MIEDKISISFISESVGMEGAESLTESLLSLLQHSFLPSPDRVTQADKKDTRIQDYKDRKILDILNDEWANRQLPVVLYNSDPDFSVSIASSDSKYAFTIEFPYGTDSETSIDQIRSFFSKVCELTSFEIGRCYTWKTFSKFKRDYFEWETRTPNFGFFTWLQYFGPGEFRKQGGELILKNPFVRTKKIGEGVLIEVGDGPLDIYNPQGEELLLKATRALPPVVKD